MAKTVFGMPGINRGKSSGGDAVAPGGAPGAKTGGSLPQKEGKDQGDAPEPEKPKTKEASTPETPSPKPPPLAKSPAMAKPAAPAIAKPVIKPSSGAPAAAKPGGGAKTMFGMPAMKLPQQPPAPSKPEEPKRSTQPGTMTTPTAKTSSPPPADEKGAAFQPTMLGVAAVGSPDEKPAEEAIRDTAPSDDSDAGVEVPTPPALPDADEPSADGFRAGVDKDSAPSFAPVAAGGKKKLWMLIGGVAVLALLTVLLFILMGRSSAAAIERQIQTNVPNIPNMPVQPVPGAQPGAIPQVPIQPAPGPATPPPTTPPPANP